MEGTVFIANRGEIAIRIIRASRLLDWKTIAIFSDEDRQSLHVRMADEAYSLGKGNVYETYLNIEKIIDLINESGATYVHPGYGFLSENAEFAERVSRRTGAKFVGPSGETIQLLGDKIEAIKVAKQVGLPVVPGSHRYIQSYEDAKEVVEAIGLPIIIKAAFGGGGKGMQIVRHEDELEGALKMGQETSQAYFGRSEVFIEKLIDSPRHVEIQFLADQHGNVIHLGDRECSIQRAHQKVIEEAPSFLSPEVREHLGEKVIDLVKSIKYENAGTAEFLYKDGKIYFNEVNPRIQVEHPITEMITGVDLVVQQLKVAAGEELEINQKDIQLRGHAIEFRINAEDPLQSYLPQSGKIGQLSLPQGNHVRFDSYIYQGYIVPSSFDSLLGKLIVWGETREEAIQRSRIALRELMISGIITNIQLHQAILETEEFKKREITTDFLDRVNVMERLEAYELRKMAAFMTVYNLRKSEGMGVPLGGSLQAGQPLEDKNSRANLWKQKGRLELSNYP